MINNYVFAYDNTTQSPTVVNTFYPITISTNKVINWWTHTASSTDFTCNQAGNYKITFNVVCQKTGGGNRDFSISIFKNGNEITGSTISRHLATDNSPGEISTSIIETLAKGDVITFRIATSNTTPANMEITPYGLSGTNDVSAQVVIDRIN